MEAPAEGNPPSGGSWSIASEIDWGTIDLVAAKSDSELLMLVRRAALRAARRTVGLGHLLAALAYDSVASALLSRELHDSWKHFHALRSYLEVAEYAPAISEAELEQHRRGAPEREVKHGDDAALRIAHLMDEAARDVAVFGLICGRAADPGLARLADRIGRDRQQHMLAVSRFLSHVPAHTSERTA